MTGFGDLNLKFPLKLAISVELSMKKSFITSSLGTGIMSLVMRKPVFGVSDQV